MTEKLLHVCRVCQRTNVDLIRLIKLNSVSLRRILPAAQLGLPSLQRAFSSTMQEKTKRHGGGGVDWGNSWEEPRNIKGVPPQKSTAKCADSHRINGGHIYTNGDNRLRFNETRSTVPSVLAVGSTNAPFAAKDTSMDNYKNNHKPTEAINWMHEPPSKRTINGYTSGRAGSIQTSGGGVNWDGDAQNYFKIQAAVSAAARKMHHPPLPENYAIYLSTEHNHKSDKREFFGPFRMFRETLDYDYHEHYTQQRQSFQDVLIRKNLLAPIIFDKYGDLCSTPTRPWLVFTAGPMGAGKGHTMRHLHKNGIFPLQAFVSVDPDHFRHQLPEFTAYVANDPTTAGKLTRKEVGYISETTTLAGLTYGRNVLVDGSLRDSDWYSGFISRIRDEYPNIRIAMIQISAPREAIFQRAADRALKTGRFVPIETLEESMEQVPKSVEVLRPMVDYYCEICNDPVDGINICTEGETWKTFKGKWSQTCDWIPGRLRNRAANGRH